MRAQTHSELDGNHFIACWDPDQGTLRYQIEQSFYAPSIAMAFSPDNQLFVTGNTEQTVCLWRTTTGELVKTLSGHTGIVISVVADPNGRYIASSSSDSTIRIWSLETGICLQTLMPPLPYANMNITGITGISHAQKTALTTLGAVEQ